MMEKIAKKLFAGRLAGLDLIKKWGKNDQA
jgi:hypothetical protein